MHRRVSLMTLMEPAGSLQSILQSGFIQVAVDEADKEKTAFGLFKYN